MRQIFSFTSPLSGAIPVIKRRVLAFFSDSESDAPLFSWYVQCPLSRRVRRDNWKVSYYVYSQWAKTFHSM